MRCLAPVLALTAAGSLLAAPAKKPPKARPLTPKQAAAAKAKAKAQAAAKAKAAALKRAAAARSASQSLPARGVSGSALPKSAPPDRPGEPFGPVKPRLGGSALPVPQSIASPLFVRTAADYASILDVKPDIVVLPGAGESWEQVDRTVQSWKQAGYPVYRYLRLGTDAQAFFTGGKADGAPHAEEVARDASGAPLAEPEGPVVLPSAPWLALLKEEIRRGVAGGSDGFWLEARGYRAAGGYSPFFKTYWKQALGSDWEAPHGSPAAFFKASRMRSDLALNAVNETILRTREYSKEAGRPLKLLLALSSPFETAAANRVLPHAAVSRLASEGVVGQLSLSEARTPVTYEGGVASLPFERSYLSFSYFANLMDGLADRSLLFSVAPGEAQAGSAGGSEGVFRQALAASLLFPQASGVDLPWPETLFGPREAGSPSPAAAAEVLNIASALREIPGQPLDWASNGTRSVGVLTLDTLGWQRGGPRGSSMRSLEGLALPLLRRGVPVQMVPAERVADNNFLSRYRVLLLSYDMQKPVGPEMNQALAQWVRSGGTLVLFGGEDPYSTIGEWWEKSGFASPTDHLLRQCGVAVDLQQRAARLPSAAFTEIATADGSQTAKTYTLPLGERAEPGKPVYLRFADPTPGTGGGVRVGRVRVIEGERVRADFTAGTVGERPFLLESVGSRAEDGHRIADGSSSFLYRFSRLGKDARVEVELEGAFTVGAATAGDPGAVLRSPDAALPGLRVGSNYPVVSYPLTGATPLYTAGEAGAEFTPAWSSAVERGTVIYCGVPPEVGADSAAGANLVRGLVRYACGKAGVQYEEGPLVARRGSYTIAHSMGRTMSLEGTYLDLFKPDVPLVQNPALPYREPALFKQVKLDSKVPSVLFGTNRTRVLEANARLTRILVDGPAGAEGVLRIFSAGNTLTGSQCIDTSGLVRQVDIRPDGRTIRIHYAQPERGLTITLRWTRPEARLTK